MSDLLKNRGGDYNKYGSKGKYHIKIVCNVQRTKIELLLERKKNITFLPYDDFSPLDYLSHNELVSLLRYYMKDCFVLNSFNKLNPRKELRIDYEDSEISEIEIIKVWVENCRVIPRMLKL